MNPEVSPSPQLIRATCYTIVYEDRDDDNRRLLVLGVYERPVDAVAALRLIRLDFHSGPVAAIDEEGMEFPSGNEIGPLRDPEDFDGNRQIGWGYRFRRPDTDTVVTLWIQQGLVFRERTHDGPSEPLPPEVVNWMDFVEQSRIDVSDDTIGTNGHVNPNESSHGFIEEID
jgi:hypothetical protein